MIYVGSLKKYKKLMKVTKKERDSQVQRTPEEKEEGKVKLGD